MWLYIYLSPHTSGLWGCILFEFRQQLGCHVLHFILVAKCYIHASIGECAHQCGSSWSAGPGCFLLRNTSHPRTSLYAQTPSVQSAWHSWYFYFRLSLTAVFQGSNLESQQEFSPWWGKKISSNTRLLLVVFNPRVDTALCQYVIPQREKCTSTCVCRFPWLLPNLKQKPTERASSYKNSPKGYIWKALAMQIWKWKK